MLKDTITKILIGGSGLGASEIAPQLLQATSPDVAGVTSVIVQLLIGIATLFGLLRKKKVA